MTTCTAEDCNRPTSLYLCTDCILELDSLLADVDPILSLIDGAIEQTSVTRSPGASGGGGHAKSKPAMNVDAWLLRSWLHQLPARAHATAMDNPKAGEILYMARIWVQQGRDLVWGPEDKRVYGQCEEPLDGEDEDDDPIPCDGRLVAHPDDATVKCPVCNTVHNVSEVLDKLRRKARGEPMPPRAVRDYLQRKARVIVTKFDFENWVKLGRLHYVLDRVTTTTKAQRIYYPGDVLEVSERMRARRRTTV
ncbi:hypothetical protein [Paenarthrobacter nicotinovorans]|uniref:hypothetical protein n=1 Tax=Paenarthrobacter nicotinovorans TaxID=29320 RepID=UPI002486BF6F|nr:hypothetical protein [Paenarthrobacter nicotinovorans]MDI2019714.1 hypothetical protein [Paenarthrobacter nicotinovorans]